MSNKNLTIGLLVAIVIAIGGYFYPSSSSLFGAASPTDVQATNYNELTANALTVNTSNTATSTASVGCVQTYATSTATPIHLEYSTTTVLASYNLGTVASGGVAWRYGACPI